MFYTEKMISGFSPVPSCLWKPRAWTSWEEHSLGTNEGQGNKKPDIIGICAPHLRCSCIFVIFTCYFSISRKKQKDRSSYLMEERWQEEDSWLADHFAESFPQQRLVEMSNREEHIQRQTNNSTDNWDDKWKQNAKKCCNTLKMTILGFFYTSIQWNIAKQYFWIYYI